MLDAVLLEFRHNRFEIWPAFYRVDIDILHAHFVNLSLNYGIVGIGNLRRTVSHDEDGIFFALLRELRGQCLDSFRYIISLFFLALPVHQRSAQCHLLELVFVVMVYADIVIVFHSRNYIKGCQCYTGVAFFFQLFQSFFRRWVADALVLLHAVNDDMGSISRYHLGIRMFGLNGLYCSIDGLGAGFLVSRAKGHHHNGILVGQISHCRILVFEHADFRSLLQCLGRSLDFLIELISCFCRYIACGESGSAGNSCC